MTIFLMALAVMGGMGVVFASGLAIAARMFSVETDPRVERIEELLSGANCGACGYPGCSNYAQAVAAGEAPPSKCRPGGEEVASEIAAVMGVEAEPSEREVAVIHCQGSNVPDRFRYEGIAECGAADLIQGGFSACVYGCLGLGSCVRACPFGALRMESGLPVVDEELCVGCGQCVKACPRGLIELRPVSDYVHVLCNSRDKGGVVRKLCKMGCIGCKKCEKVCEFEAITVADNLARIDYEKCTSCGLCVKECPTGVILNLRKQRKSKAKAAAA